MSIGTEKTAESLQEIRALIAKHKRWDQIFIVIGIACLMVGVLAFSALFLSMVWHGWDRLTPGLLHQLSIPQSGAGGHPFGMGRIRSSSCS